MGNNGRPPRNDIDMAQVRALATSLSIREIGRRLNIPCGTLSYRLRRSSEESPFCVTCRNRMRGRKTKRGKRFWSCPLCGFSTIPAAPRRHRRGRPPREFDTRQVSKLLQDHPVIYVADMLGVHRNVLYSHITRGRITGRPFRAWIPRPGWIRPERSALSLYWPYMSVNDPRYEGVIREVNEAVSRDIPDAIRSDVCQEIVVSVLTGEIRRDGIKSAVKQYLQHHFKMFPTRGYQTVSLDAPIRSNGHDKHERTLIDMLDAETYYGKMATTRYGDTLADCSTAEDLAQRLTDRWDANRLTKDRKSYSTFTKANGDKYGDPDYERLRRKYGLFNGRVHSFESERDSYGGAWTIENALPEEIRWANEEAHYQESVSV